MKNTDLKIFIDKYSYKKGEDYNLSFLPMLIRRKLRPLSKIAFSSLYECYENNDVTLVFASKYSEFEKLIQLSKQYKEDNEISPIAFSTSVHNATVGAFSLLNKINGSYTSIGASNYSFHAGLLDGILSSQEKDTLFCYADYGESFSCLIKKNSTSSPIKLELADNEKVNSIAEFEEFLQNKRNEFLGNNYILKRNI